MANGLARPNPGSPTSPTKRPDWPGPAAGPGEGNKRAHVPSLAVLRHRRNCLLGPPPVQQSG
eukprot:5877214-Alexandrium_andersonii.AAC.1